MFNTIFRFINKLAVRSYRRELHEFIDTLSGINTEALARFLIVSVWTRAGLQTEGRFCFPAGKPIRSPQLTAYPHMLSFFEDVVKIFRQRGQDTEAAGISIWVHTLRCLINYHKMNDDLDRLWKVLMTTRDFWEENLQRLCDEDKDIVEPTALREALELSRAILRTLPPKPSLDYIAPNNGV